MNKFMTALTSSTVPVLVSTGVHEGGFVLSIGLLGKTITTSPALTRQILDSPEFDQLLGPERAMRVLELVLDHAQH